jgi:hypothetical protein
VVLVDVFEVLRRMQNALVIRLEKGREYDRWGEEKVIDGDWYTVLYVPGGNDSVCNSHVLASVVEYRFLDSGTAVESGTDVDLAAEVSNTCCSRNSVFRLLVFECTCPHTCHFDSCRNRLRRRT